ncbi:hypothetical protein DL93DRAFT_313778 [Clavulina sp. PMI_390]|nr:hypothetical protein DL93DRAFT_313778 [Clavulina sp. PMI_390]
MTDLTYCYLHMPRERLDGLEFYQEIDFGPLEPDGEALDIPEEHIPPDPEDADCLPSQMHTSYPYGNPLKLNHPAALGTYPFGSGDARLYASLSYEPHSSHISIMSTHSYMNAQAQSQSLLRWHDMALDELLPIDPKTVAAEMAARARRGATGMHNPAHAGTQVDNGGDLPPPVPPDGEGEVEGGVPPGGDPAPGQGGGGAPVQGGVPPQLELEEEDDLSF